MQVAFSKCVGEELGLVCTLAVVLCFLIVLVSGTVISLRASDRFGRLLGVGIVLLRWERLQAREREDLIAWWSRRMLAALGVGLEVDGQFRTGGALIVANHVSFVDALVIAADWPEFRSVDLAAVRAALARGLVVDGRNLLDPAAARAAGLDYVGIGR